jgi:hypothetical protein
MYTEVNISKNNLESSFCDNCNKTAKEVGKLYYDEEKDLILCDKCIEQNNKRGL